MINWRNTKLPKLEGEDEITSVFEMLTNKTYELGFQYCSFKMSSQIPKNKAKPIDINNYPSEWSTLYDQAHFFDIDPVVQHCKTSVLPVVWEEKTFRDSPNLWSLARSRHEVSPEELYEKAGQVLWLCHAMHAVVAQKYAASPDVIAASTLTAREREVLKWSAMGKTAADIAAILCLSERTIGYHICSCFKKLGVNNKIAAVLCAARSGII